MIPNLICAVFSQTVGSRKPRRARPASGLPPSVAWQAGLEPPRSRDDLPDRAPSGGGPRARRLHPRLQRLEAVDGLDVLLDEPVDHLAHGAHLLHAADDLADGGAE
jgi:hypothetical protein